MSKNYLLTGATGFVGRFILKELLEKDLTSRISLLIRESNGFSGHQKAEQLLTTLFSSAQYQQYLNRIQVFEGDVTFENFGLSADLYRSLAETTNIIFHAAASIEYDLTLEDATLINVEGTRTVLKLAEKCMANKVLERMNHISTAYVVGKQKKSSNSPDSMEFANTYEQTKFNAEKLVESYINAGLPVTIYRPSIIFGHSVTGEITIGNILYLFMMMFSRKMLPVFPCEPDSSLNIIPINYFIDLMLAISKLPESIGKTYNITHYENTNIQEMIRSGCGLLGVPVPQFVPFARMDTLGSEIPEPLGPFMNYIQQSHYFDISATRALLKNNFRECDDIITCTAKIIDYCSQNRLLRVKKRLD